MHQTIAPMIKIAETVFLNFCNFLLFIASEVGEARTNFFILLAVLKSKARQIYLFCNKLQVFSVKNICFFWYFMAQFIENIDLKRFARCCKILQKELTNKKICALIFTDQKNSDFIHKKENMKNKDPPKSVKIFWKNILSYTILFYTIRSFWSRNLQKLTTNPLYKIKIKTMKNAQKSFDLVKSTKNNTIDLAEILGVAPMKPIQETIKIKIEKILTKNEGIQEIPVRILNQSENIWFEQLEDLVTFNLASKAEFRYWKKIRSYFSL